MSEFEDQETHLDLWTEFISQLDKELASSVPDEIQEGCPQVLQGGLHVPGDHRVQVVVH